MLSLMASQMEVAQTTHVPRLAKLGPVSRSDVTCLFRGRARTQRGRVTSDSGRAGAGLGGSH
jgi:hypothetical protein